MTLIHIATGSAKVKPSLTVRPGHAVYLIRPAALPTAPKVVC
jgi:hypothetical protein